jgi:hypothetical protein
MLNFIETSGALAAGQLTDTNVGLSFHNVQRKRLEKYGKQYISTDHQPVTLESRRAYSSRISRVPSLEPSSPIRISQ